MTRLTLLALIAIPAFAGMTPAQSPPDARYNSLFNGYVSPALLNTPYGRETLGTLSAINASPNGYTVYQPNARVSGSFLPPTTIYVPAAATPNTGPTLGANPFGPGFDLFNATPRSSVLGTIIAPPAGTTATTPYDPFLSDYSRMRR